ncbi:MAG TPA: hypothetical protein VI685_16655 [Candidatus Angelobacter sp.]
MLTRAFFLFSTLFLFTFSAAAQQAACTAPDIPVSVIKANGDSVEGLVAADFIAELKKQPLPIQSATYDAGPRRILLVMDETRELSADARKAEVEFAATIVSSAQPADSLALVTARGSAREVKFGAERSALMQSLNESREVQGKGKQLGVLDAVAEGISWFEPPQLGDSIVLIAMDLEGNHNTNLKSVTRLLEEHRIRLFGVALGHLELRNQTSAVQMTGRQGMGYVDPGMPMWGQMGDANFLPLTVNSGGYIVPEDTLSKLHEFKLTDIKKQQLQKTASTMSGLIDKFYAVRISSTPSAHSEPWTLGLNPGKLQGLPGAHVLYPHEVGPCPAAAAGR